MSFTILCVPVAEMPVAPVPSVQDRCEGCGEPVWLSHRTAHGAARDHPGHRLRPLCLHCGLVELEGATPEELRAATKRSEEIASDPTLDPAVRPGPPSIPPGEAPRGVVVHVYDRAGLLLARSVLRPGDEEAPEAERAADEAFGTGAAEVCLVAYDGDTGERMAWPPEVRAGDPYPITLLPEDRCPYCGARFTAATAVAGGARPKAGDPTLCIDCAGLLVYGADLRVRFPTDAELLTIARWPEVARARSALLDLLGRPEG